MSTTGLPPRAREPFDHGRAWMLGCGVVGVVGVVVALVFAFLDGARAWQSYLFAYLFWLSIVVGAIGWLAGFHASSARFVVVVRRLFENAAATGFLYVILFIPVLIGLKQLYPWVEPSSTLDAEARRLVAHKHPYLNLPFFVIRAAIYFGAWVAIGWLLRAWSLRQDATGDARYTFLQRKLSGAALPIVAFTWSFAGIDWVMSLTPEWTSTMYGFYVIAAALDAGMAGMILYTVLVERTGRLTGYINPNHYHALGKYLLAFTCFWAYIAFCQFMLIWIANLPEEIPYYVVRMRGAWAPISWVLIAGHFALPFVVLLSRGLKLRPLLLGAVAVWMLAAHAVDIYWLVVPSPARPAALPHWTIAPAFVGVGGLAIATLLWLTRGRPIVPIGDPYLDESTRYHR